MATVFRRIRQRLLIQNKITRYLAYAAGEIILVVIGILIALQINNNNAARLQREKEVHYLENLRADLRNNVDQINDFMDMRNGYMESATIILDHLEGKPVTDWNEFTTRCISIYSWKRFYQVDFTFQELTNSGNLALISNDSIKAGLLQLESKYRETKAEEDHFRFDSEELLYKPVYRMMDLNPMIKEFMGVPDQVNTEYFADFFRDPMVKNGFIMVLVEFSTMNEQLTSMRELCERLIEDIGKEIDA